MKPLHVFLVLSLFVLLLCFVALADAQVVSVTPAQNALNVSPNTTVQVTFAVPMDTTTFNDTTSFLVYGRTSGRHKGTFVFTGGNTIVTFTLTTVFKKGEVVTVDVTNKIKTTTNVAITPVVFEFTIITNVSTGKFMPKTDFITGNDPFSLFVNDVDGDADVDIVVANYGSGTVSILKNIGDGSFASKIDYGVGSYPFSVFVADLDLDGDGDLVVANSNSNTVSILKNNGDGTFIAKVDYATGSVPISVFINDVDGDGDNDAVTANYASNTVSILKNNGGGTFAEKVDYATGSYPYSVFISDLDSDGDGDIAVSNQGDATVSILKNNGDGTFAIKIDYYTGGRYQNPFSININDIDGDGDGDVAVANWGSNTISILKNHGDGTFASMIVYPSENSPFSPFLSDVEGDGDADIVVANYGSGTVSILKNNGDGSFAPKINYGVGSGPHAIYVSDVEGDGNADIVVANRETNTISILKNITNDVSIQSNTPADGFLSKSYSLAVSASVKNFSPTAKTFTTLAQIDTTTGTFSSSLYSNTQTVASLGSNQAQTVYFGNWTASNNGQYKQRVITQLSEDEDHSNDTLVTTFTVLVPSQSILVVYQDSAKEGQTVKDALTNKGYSYDQYFQSEYLPFSFSGWEIVVWQDSALSAANADSLISFLNSGGKLFLLGNRLASSQSEDASTISPAMLMRKKLGVNWASNFTSSTTVNGTMGDSVGNGLSFSLGIGSGSKEKTTKSGNYVFLDSIMTYSVGGNAGWKRDNGTYKIVYAGIPIHNSSPESMREKLIDQAIRWLASPNQVGSVYGSKFNDVNGNGIKDSNETGIQNCKIFLYRAFDGNMDSTLTDNTGNYFFKGIFNGQYTLSEATQSGWIQTLPAFSGTYIFNINTGDSLTGKDFGNFQLGTISGKKFNDVNGNGVKDDGEYGLSNWIIRLSGTKTDSVLTDEDGNFIFFNLTIGNYMVSEKEQSGWTQTFPASSGMYNLTVSSGSNYTGIDFGNHSLAGFIAELAISDNSGTRDTLKFGLKQGATYGLDLQFGERELPPLPNGVFDIRFWLKYAIQSKIDIQDMLKSGHFQITHQFRIQPGSGGYPMTLRWKPSQLPILNNPIRLRDSSTQGGIININMKTDSVLVVSNSSLHFFEIVYSYTPASISGNNFLDNNGNGIKDSIESGLTGWTIALSGAANGTTSTEASGNFSFTQLGPGTYALSKSTLAGWIQTTPDPQPVKVVEGTTTAGILFGNFELGSINGTVFYDRNTNGVYDYADTTLSNWNVYLSGTVNSTTTTDANGSFTFSSLQIGTYSVKVEKENGWIQLTPTSPDSFSITINSSGKTEVDKNFGLLNSASSEYRLGIKVTDNGNEFDSLFLGRSYFATDGIDTLLNEYELSPQPIGGTFDARWMIPSTNGTETDFRPLFTLDHVRNVYTCEFQPGVGGYPFTVQWSQAELDNGQWTIQDASTHGQLLKYDMNSGNSLSITNSAITSFEIVNVATITVPYQLAENWNIISLPVTVPNRVRTSLFPTATSEAFKFYQFYRLVGSLDYGLGYWLKFGNAQIATVSGLARTHDTLSVDAGWNMIGSLSLPVAVASIVTDPPNIIISSIFAFDKGYKVANIIKPANGYWVKVGSAGKIFLNPLGIINKQNAYQVESWGKFNSLTITDVKDNQQTLYFSTSEEPSQQWPMPPPPPSGIFDSRFASNNYVEFGEKGKLKEVPIKTTSAEYPITISWDINEQTIFASLIIDRKEISLIHDNKIQISNHESQVRLKLPGTAEPPKEYALEQNYPNPFNPTTIFHYQLPIESRVTLTIFNVLGQEVATLVDEIQDAGYRSKEWNALGAAGGVYFYRIEVTSVSDPANSFHKVKKMLLIK